MLKGYIQRAAVGHNGGRAYHGNTTQHREETDVEGTHVSAKVWYPVVRMNTYEMRGRHTRAKKNASADSGGFKTTTADPYNLVGG